MKFLIDENIYYLTSNYLKQNKYLILDIKEMGLSGIADDKVFEIACEEDCVLLPLDKDFTDIRKYPPKTHPGIVVIRIKPPTVDKIEKALENLLNEDGIADKMKGTLVILEENRYRIRKLPLED